MKEIAGDIWSYHAQGHWITVTTNGIIRNDGWAVMGRGIAEQAARRFPNLAGELGEALRDGGNHVWAFPAYRLFTFPVKTHWRDRATVTLIRQSTRELLSRFDAMESHESGDQCYLVRPGCGHGGQSWGLIRPILAELLDDRFTVVEWRVRPDDVPGDGPEWRDSRRVGHRG